MYSRHFEALSHKEVKEEESMRRALSHAFASSSKATTTSLSSARSSSCCCVEIARRLGDGGVHNNNSAFSREKPRSMHSTTHHQQLFANDGTEGFAAKMWAHMRTASSSSSSDDDGDDDAEQKTEEERSSAFDVGSKDENGPLLQSSSEGGGGGGGAAVKTMPPPRVISVRDFASQAWANVRGSGERDSKSEDELSSSTKDFAVDFERKMMKDWTPRETLEFLERGASPGDPRDFMDDEAIREYEAMKRKIDEAPAKQRRFLLNQALKGRVFSSVQDEEDREREALVKSLQQKVIDVNRTCKVTKGGGLMNFTAMVVVGNGRGVVGFATGKANEVGPAIEKATKKAARSLTYVERFENHTIFHELHGKCGKTRVKMMPSNSGSGRRCNDIIDAICELAGIRDLKAKVTGSHHPHNTVRAVFEALAGMQTPRSVAVRRGMKVYQV